MNLPTHNQAGIEGQINITLKQGRQVSILSSRPLHASQILAGKTPEQALQTIPLLFSACGAAQSLTGLTALNAARGIETNRHRTTAHIMLVLVETARESLLRLIHDIPKLLKLSTADQSVFSYIGSLLQGFKTTLFHTSTNDNTNKPSFDSHTSKQLHKQIDEFDEFLKQNIYAQTARSFAQMEQIDKLYEWSKHTKTLCTQATGLICDQGWASQGHTNDYCSPLPDLPLDRVAEKLSNKQAERFVAHPQWDEQCHETGSLARQWQHPLTQNLRNEFGIGLLSRWTARLLELATIPDQLRQCLMADKRLTINRHFSPSSGIGIASVEAARGCLMHMVKLENNIIQQYRILAPTEWNFHPQGPVIRILSALGVSSIHEREQLAHISIHSIDPCVAYQLEVT